MGRHSRKGPAPKGASTSLTGTSGIPFVPSGAARPAPEPPVAHQGYGSQPRGGPMAAPPVRSGHPEAYEAGGGWGTVGGPQGRPPGPSAHTGGVYGDWRGTPRPNPQTNAQPAYGTQAQGSAGHGTPAQGGHAYGTPAQGTAGHGTPAQGTAGYGTPAPGSPAYGSPVFGTPAHGTPAHGTPVYGSPGQGQGQGHGHGSPGYAHGAQAYGTPAQGIPAYGSSQARVAQATRPVVPGQRSGDIEAFEDEVFSTGAHRRVTPLTEQPTAAGEPEEPREPEGLDEPEQPAKGGRARTFTGIAAAAVTTVLAVVVAGQVAGGEKPAGTQASDTAGDREEADSASRSNQRPAPPEAPAAPPAQPVTFAQKMAKQYPIDPQLKASGNFEAVPGFAKAPGRGERIRYRVDIEKGLRLDGGLFAEAVQKTLNDDRSWAHNGGMTFERVSSGEADFVITLASPATTGVWCAKSGLDTTVDNVSCDSASTDRVMINAFRWAQGADTYGPDQMLAYRQMLINHEVGHRLGHGHVSCKTPGALAPIMQQQTKSLDLEGVKCKPNPWVHPGS
ncbi:DUF3152 domain-containing protein [Streptomyces sp. A3M-1-3]|uniref:DUF3152 domain-containing protein n=1 Tax=Streptomyces sp. A3M-1-3 TaxID=2962044 RepID=UPI0020B66507|nr:DUF3152 domain-containing protein [Streptomyces sp. A3M-1-3]MCP3821577.1 DUF3152 domain-containing protein [Streptomyces sp. A3M-1-3]